MRGAVQARTQPAGRHGEPVRRAAGDVHGHLALMRNATATDKRCAWASVDGPLLLRYHDREWGVPVHNDRKHFEALVLSGAQAGLYWSLLLIKREGQRRAFGQFDAHKIRHCSD